MNFKRINEYVVKSECNRYLLSSLQRSVKRFNNECPKYGWLIDRDNIEKVGRITHLIKSLTYAEEELIAKIEILSTVENIKVAKMKPIIMTPLSFESGVIRIIKIINVSLEI